MATGLYCKTQKLWAGTLHFSPGYDSHSYMDEWFVKVTGLIVGFCSSSVEPSDSIPGVSDG